MGMGFATLGSVSPDAGFFAFDHSQPLMAAQLAGTVKTVLSDPQLKTRILLLTITLLISFGLLAECPIVGSYHKRRAAVERLLSETARALSSVVDRQLNLSEAQLRALAASPYSNATTGFRFPAKHGRP